MGEGAGWLSAVIVALTPLSELPQATNAATKPRRAIARTMSTFMILTSGAATPVTDEPRSDDRQANIARIPSQHPSQPYL
jgi:hypothetical protein